MTKVISFGYRCSSASFIQLLNLKTESYPFDWMISKLNTIIKCIETDFKDFYNIENYIYKTSETVNIIDGNKIHLVNENVLVNMLYEKFPENNYTLSYQLACNHKNIKDDLEYYKRCILRLNELLKSDIKKIYIYIHPILGNNDFNTNKNNILEDFKYFNSYILSKTSNIFGIYFIMLKTCSIKKISDIIESSDKYVVIIIYCNENFLDGGSPFMGNCLLEQNEIISILKMYI